MEMIDFVGCELDDPLRIFLIPPRDGGSNYCRFKMNSIPNATKFVDKFNNTTIEHNDDQKVNVFMVDPSEMEKAFPDEEFESLKKSKWLRITNLKHEISEHQLTEHIQKQSKVTPKSVDIRHHSNSNFPSFAFVQIGNLKDTKKVTNKL